jgi:carbamoyltransferase
MKDYLNSRVKFREEFRPFAPAILYEHTRDYFSINQESPHMLISVKVKEEKIEEIPAVIHIDKSARIQTVTSENNLPFRKLLESFYKLTKCPVILNTSFNVKGQPIVNSPEDALKCFLATNIDILVMGNFFISKTH